LGGKTEQIGLTLIVCVLATALCFGIATYDVVTRGLQSAKNVNLSSAVDPRLNTPNNDAIAGSWDCGSSQPICQNQVWVGQ
jgi:hypothetical protein